MSDTDIAIENTLEFLREMADKLDQWAIESRSGGWSTHQVQSNIQAANDCRRQAAELRRAAFGR